HDRAIHPGRHPLGARDDLGAVLRGGVRTRRARRHARDRHSLDRLHPQVPVPGDRGGKTGADPGARGGPGLPPRDPAPRLVAAGASPLAILLKGYWPQVKPAFLAISAFRWDINVRESAVLGLVGGGGLGMALDTALSNLYWDQAGLVLIVIFGVVIVTEIV